MRPLRYSINVTLDGCVDHTAASGSPELHRHVIENFRRADALLFGRVTYEMMETAFRPGVRGDWMDEWMVPFAETIDAARKHVVSSTLERVDWNAELLRGDLETEVRRLKALPGKGLLTGGVRLPGTLAALDLIDEYEFVSHPTVAGRGPYLLAGLPSSLELRLTERLEFQSGAVALRYEPVRRRE